MISFHGCSHLSEGKHSMRSGLNALFPVVLVAIFLAATAAWGQVAPTARAGGVSVSVGDAGSGFYVQYGARKLLGVSAFVDADTMRHWGLEGEARWLVFHRTAGIQDSTYMAGPRYYFNSKKKLQPYAKVLAGVGFFTFANDTGHGSYFVLEPGAGVDLRVTPRLSVRLADFEYQYWPQFTFGAMSSGGISVGIRYRVN
jgi:hypothetical protein